MRRQRPSFQARLKQSPQLFGPCRGADKGIDSSDNDGTNMERMRPVNVAILSRDNNPVSDKTKITKIIEIPADTTKMPDVSKLPATPWRTSKAKQRIIDELKDEESDIYLSIGKFTLTDFSNVNFKQILKDYADNKYKLSRFRENVKLRLKHSLNKTGPFETKEKGPEQWYTSVNNVSKAYSLLFLLHMDPSKSHIIDNMTAEQIWKSHSQFQQYELDRFKTYNSNMKKLTGKRKHQIINEEAAYHEDMLKIPKASITTRGHLFWYNHPAVKLLENDELSGIAKQMRPIELWKSRPEYEEFPLAIFRKHIYQERAKQLAAPYWQYKRNKNAKKKFEESQEMLKEWDEVQHKKNVGGLIEG